MAGQFKLKPWGVLLIGCMLLLLLMPAAHAEINNLGVLDDILQRYNNAASAWATRMTTAATFLFWTLVVISMVWTFGIMAMRRAELGEFFAEFVRFIMFTGFFWWLLVNGPAFATSIYASLRQLAGEASGLGSDLLPSGIVDVGFGVIDMVFTKSSAMRPLDSLMGFVMGAAILVILILVAVNMMLLIVAGWILAYGGVFFLGFGGSRWTSDMAIGYYKNVLGIAAQLMTMVLLVGIARTFLNDYYNAMDKGLDLMQMAVMMSVCLILLILVNKVPPMIAGIATGAGVGSPIGNYGAGSALAVAGAAAAGVAAGVAAMKTGAANIAGGAQALHAAFSKAAENVSSGNDVMAAFSGGGGGDDASAAAGSSSEAGSTPFAQAAGFGSSGGTSTGGGGGGRSGGSSSSDTAADAGGNSQAPSSGGRGLSGGSASGAAQQQAGGSAASADQAAKTPPKATSGAPQGTVVAPGQQGPGLLASAASALATAGRIAVDAGANLASGTAAVAKEKTSEVRDAAMARIGDTTGGKVAAAIRASSPGNFGDNSLSGTRSEDWKDEIAAFVDRQTPA